MHPRQKVSKDNSGNILLGIKRSLPVALSVLTYGISFGVLARQAGLSVTETLLMSSLVFAGTSQFVALEMWQSPLPIAAIVFTTFAINLRHILMGAALSPLFSHRSSWQAYSCYFFLNDESWALTMSEVSQGGQSAGFFFGSGLTIFVAFVTSTVTGQLIGQTLSEPRQWGLDFAFTAVFIALLVSLWGGKESFIPWLTAAIVAVVSAYWLPSAGYILLGGLAGSLVGVMCDAG
ncbi:MAG: AzlC family ABC transporter permease [Cyanobacteria bacterium P01_G01_bin.38]